MVQRPEKRDLATRPGESPSIKSKLNDVAEAVAAVKRDLIGELPKIRRAGRTDASDPAVSVTALTPVLEPIGTLTIVAVVLAD
jgi:hypothetical protein